MADDRGRWDSHTGTEAVPWGSTDAIPASNPNTTARADLVLLQVDKQLASVP